MSRHEFPSLEAIDERLDAFVAAHGDVAHMESLGESAEGREVRAVRVTDGGVSEAEKEMALVICGRHGNELGTRVVGPAVLDWLASDQAAETRRRQAVFVVPVANPDGCSRNEFAAPPRHLSETEQRTLVALACRTVPDAVIDVHSFGPDDADLQAVVTGNNSREAGDEVVYHRLAGGLIDGAARAGYPFVLHTEKRNEGYNNFIAGFCYDRFHSLAFGMEVNHHALGPAEAAESGAAVVRSLLEAGNARWPWQATPGYPNRIVKGDLFTSIRAAGGDAAGRRTSRAALWPGRKFLWLGRREMPTTRTVRAAFGYSGYAAEAEARCFELCCRLRGFPADVKARLNGHAVETHTFSDLCSTYVSVAVRPTRREDYELTIEF